MDLCAKEARIARWLDPGLRRECVFCEHASRSWMLITHIVMLGLVPGILVVGRVGIRRCSLLGDNRDSRDARFALTRE